MDLQIPLRDATTQPVHARTLSQIQDQSSKYTGGLLVSKAGKNHKTLVKRGQWEKSVHLMIFEMGSKSRRGGNVATTV